MAGRKLFVAAAAAALVLLSLSPAAAADKAWYAPRLEKLGFYVFDPPMAYQDFKVASLAGPEKTRSSLKGKIVLLNFWATWCPPCKEEIPTIESLSRSMKGKNFDIMAVSLGEDPATVKSFVAEQKMSFPVYLDPRNSLARTYASQGIPTTYLLDKEGRFIAGIVGGYNYADAELTSLLDEMAKR